jgi:plastocyanin
MRYTLVLASTYLVGASAFVGACSSSNSTPAGNDGGTTSSATTAASSSATTAASSSATTAASSSATTAASSSGGAATCAGAGTVVTEPWDFTASANTLNSGKGQVLSIHVCDTIQWMNDDQGIPHSVVGTSANAKFINTTVVTGATPAVPLSPVQFTQAGTFTYWCGVHTSMMIGQVTVQ